MLDYSLVVSFQTGKTKAEDSNLQGYVRLSVSYSIG